MAIEKKRMQQRYGTYQQFQDNINNLLPNEFASVVSDDPNTDSGEGLYFQCGSNTPKRILTEEDKSLPVVTTVDVNSDNDHIPTAKSVYDYSAPKSAVNNINTEIQHIWDALNDKVEADEVQEMIEAYAASIASYNYLNNQVQQLWTDVNDLPTVSEVQQMIDDSIAAIPRAEGVLYGN